jgi:hypothetical protein
MVGCLPVNKNLWEKTMSKINKPRVLLGGLLAGLVMNVGEAALHAGVLGKETEALYKTWNFPLPNPAQTIPLLVGTTFLMGIVSIWLYAAILPHFETRTKTVLIASIAIWLLMHVWSGVYVSAGYSGIFTYKLAWFPVYWGLLEATLAVFAGALIYRER